MATGHSQPELYRARMIASVAATAISLACGTNYVYSAWAPQFGDRLKLSSTESNLIGLAGNLGMYSLGIPVGMLVDHRGPRPAVIAGSLLLGLGYFPLHQAYDRAAGHVALLSFFSFLTGLGGCMAFAAAVKTSALNWPDHRGTATAFPLAAFGLSAFFFSAFGGLFFPGDTSVFLATLAIGTFTLTFTGFFFLRVLPRPGAHRPDSPILGEAMVDSQELHRVSSDTKHYHSTRRLHRESLSEPGTSHHTRCRSESDVSSDNVDFRGTMRPASLDKDLSASLTSHNDLGELSSLISRPSSTSDESFVQSNIDVDRSYRVDIRGFQLFRELDFWQLFLIMGTLTGIGLMTINNTGHNVNALWRHWDDHVDEAFLISQQQLHVSILSICSFLGRLLSGVGSDWIVKSLHGSRTWCLVASSIIFSVAQMCALTITNPHLLGWISGLSGLAYGILFGVFPSIVAESFGVHGLSQNWGFMTLSPVMSGNIFNIFYGTVFDRQSIVGPSGERICYKGIECYAAAYLMTLGACFVGFVVTIWVIRHQNLTWRKDNNKGHQED